MKNLLLMICLLFPLAASAQSIGSWNDGPVSQRDGTVGVTVGGAAFTALPINVAVTTDAVKLKGLRYIMFTLKYTYASATAVTMTCQNSEDNVSWADIHMLAVNTAPTLTSGVAVWSYAAGASKTWNWSVPVRGVYFRCTFTGVAGGAGDTLTLTARGGF